LKTIQPTIAKIIEDMKSAYIKNGLDKQWEALHEKHKKLEEDKANSRRENHKQWLREHWLKNNSEKIQTQQKKLNHYNTELKKCATTDSKCMDEIQKKIDWYTKIISSLTKMRSFYNGDLESSDEKKFEMTAEYLDLEKNLLYYKNHYAKNELSIIDTTITKDYLDLEMTINPDLNEYSTQRKTELEVLLKNMDSHAQLLKNKEIEFYNKLKKFYEGFDEEWENRKQKFIELNEYMESKNAVEVVRHIKEHWIDKISSHKKNLNQHLRSKMIELDECKDDVCEQKVQKIIDWLKKAINNMDQIIKFFEAKMEQYMDKDDVKIMEEVDDEEDDEVMESDKKNQSESIKEMNDNEDSNVNPIDSIEDSLEDDVNGEETLDTEEDFGDVYPRASD